MSKRAENKIELKAYIDKKLKEEFRYYSELNKSDMSKELTKLVESYIKRERRKASKVL